jgi:hypothetical protein
MTINIRYHTDSQVRISSRPRRARLLEVDGLEARRLLTVYNVNSLADILSPPSGTVTLRSAIAAANASAAAGVSNTIELSVPGTYDLPLGELAITGAVGYELGIFDIGRGRAVIDGGGVNGVFDINSFGEVVPTFTVLLDDLTITGGSESYGGGVDADNGSSLILDNVDLTDNDAIDEGGGVYVQSGSLSINGGSIVDNTSDSGGGVYAGGTTSITNAFFQGNRATVAGGALSLNGSVTDTVANTRLTTNLAGSGGAIDDEAGALALQSDTLDQNHAFASSSVGSVGSVGLGGALYVSSTATSGAGLTVANCLFLDNAAVQFGLGEGGAIMVESGPLTIENSELSGNHAAYEGGAIDFGGSTLTMTGTTIDNSRAGNGGGGGLYFFNTTSTSSFLTNDTMTLNSAFFGGGIDVEGTGNLSLLHDTINANFGKSGGGGVLMNSLGQLQVADSIIAENTLSFGTGPDVIAEPSLDVVSTGGNLIGDATGSVGFTAGPLIGTAAKPVNPQLAPLLDNGSLAPYTPYTLNGTSVQFDAGTTGSLQVVPTEALLTSSPAFSAGLTTPLATTDERGFARPATKPSIGAYQPEYAANSTPAQVYVETLYETLLNRTSDAGGLAFWTPFVNLSVSNASVIQEFENSTEYRDDQINLFYQSYVGRAADSGGMGYFIGILNAGGTLSEVKALLLGSSEYADDHGLYSVNVVESIYENVLNRLPTMVEADNWVRVLAVGTPLSAVASDFIFSQEDETDLIVADYTGYLSRSAAESDVTFWLAIEASSTDPESTLNDGILGSPETIMARTDG